MAVKPTADGYARQPRMPRESEPRRQRPPRGNDRFVHDLIGVGLVVLALVLVVSLFAGSRAGALGVALALALRALVGVGAFAVPVLCAATGIAFIWGREQQTRANVLGGATLLFVVVISWWHLAHTSRATAFVNPAHAGGWIGAGVSYAARVLLGTISSHILFLGISVAAIVWATDMRLIRLGGHAVNGGKAVVAPIARGAVAARNGAAGIASRRSSREVPADPLPVEPKRRRTETRPSAATVAGNGSAHVSMDSELDAPTFPAGRNLFSAADVLPFVPDPVIEGDSALLPTIPAQPTELAIPPSLGDDGSSHAYKLPDLNLLSEAPPPPVRQEKLAQERQDTLMRTLRDFNIGANVSQVAVGPTVTRYEVQLEPGILVKKIVSLADNLAMSLAAIDVRVEAPIPGKAAIGIEVPNDVAQMVSLRECLAQNQFQQAASKLTFALGKDVSGEYKYADLARMPHLLVGGSTNSGKSVCLNVIISSLLYRATPREVKFVMIDPKRVELSLYDGIPHLLSPVIKNVKQAAGIFRSVLREMEDRYDKFAQLGTRNLEGYNSRVTVNERLPFIVVVVDELADLMMQQGPEVETSICRLAQLARATGIHLIIATQRPSVDVITGTIKANISSRIAFTVATQVDSRTIIDMPGADRLIGRGDMLFMPIDAAKPVRIQGCYVGERETETLVRYLREQEQPVYTMSPSEPGDGAMGNVDAEDDGSSDELYEPCVRWLVSQGQCSTSSLQRKFKIGYTRAARLVEVMEAQNIVGAQDGVKPREMLLRPENLETFFLGRQQGDLGQ